MLRVLTSNLTYLLTYCAHVTLANNELCVGSVSDGKMENDADLIGTIDQTKEKVDHYLYSLKC